jgi:hypothetical protein
MDKTCFHTLRGKKLDILDCKLAFVNTIKFIPCFSNMDLKIQTMIPSKTLMVDWRGGGAQFDSSVKEGSKTLTMLIPKLNVSTIANVKTLCDVQEYHTSFNP